MCAGVVIGAWPAVPGLAECCNLADLPAVTGVPLLGAVPEGAGDLAPAAFADVARHSLGSALGGGWQTPGRDDRADDSADDSADDDPVPDPRDRP